MTALTVQGFLKNINQFNQLIISLNDTTKLKELTHDWKGHSPLYEVQKEEKTYNTFKVSLAPRDKNVARRFNAIADLTGSKVEMKLTLTKFDFKNSDDEQVVGWKATLVTIKRLEKVPVKLTDIEVQLNALKEVQDDWVPPPELPKRQTN